MKILSGFRKLTYKRELEVYLTLNVLCQIALLILYFGWNVPYQLGVGLVIINVFIYLFQIIRHRNKNVQFDKILNKSYKRVDIVEYLTSLDEFKSSLISLNEPEDVANMSSNYIKQILKSKHAHVFLWDEQSGSFHPKPEPSDPKLNISFYVYDPFILWLSDNPRLVLKSDLENLLGHMESTLKKGYEFFEKTNSKIVIPLVLNKGLLGILSIGSKKSDEEYDMEDYDHLSEIVEVSVLSLSNSIFYKQLISMTENLEAKVKERTRELEETQSQLVMSEKMASLGVMVAGIAHEINTPAGVINAASDNLNENMLYTYKNVNNLYEYLNVHEIRRHFRKILIRLLHDKPVVKIVPTNKFKIKRETKEKLLKAGLNEKDASDGSIFLVDNSIPELIDDLVALYKSNAYPLIEMLKTGVASARNIRNIKYSIKNIVRIVKALKYYSHLDQSSYGEADITEAVENTLVIMNNQIKQGIEIDRQYSDLPKIYCNIDELNQVWTNLINNAIHAIRSIENPKITISTNSLELAGNPYVSVTVQDNGIGVPNEIKDRIWDPFFTTKDQGDGSGLGLGIVKGILEKHKGTIKVESKPGDTKFIVYLPINRPKEDSLKE
ncbi:MAG: GHKL domain-containing protein [Leptospira sp.]|nr:GHKL domain-containing protein [Leptospira sp.]